MTASTDASFAFDQPLLSGGRHFSTADYHVARRFVERSTRGLFDLSLPSAREFRQYDVSSARLGETLFSLVEVDSVSGYDIEMMDDPDLVLLHILMRGNAQLQQGAAKVEVAPAQLVVLEGMGRSHKRWHGTTRQLLVRLSRSRMERIVASETGIGIGDPLNFGVMQVVDLARGDPVELPRHDLPRPQRSAALLRRPCWSAGRHRARPDPDRTGHHWLRRRAPDRTPSPAAVGPTIDLRVPALQSSIFGASGEVPSRNSPFRSVKSRKNLTRSLACRVLDS